MKMALRKIDGFHSMLNSYQIYSEERAFVRGLRDIFRDKKEDSKIKFFLDTADRLSLRFERLEEKETVTILNEIMMLYNNQIAKFPLANPKKIFSEESKSIFEEIKRFSGIKDHEKGSIVKILVGLVSSKKELDPPFRIKKLGNNEATRLVRI